MKSFYINKVVFMKNMAFTFLSIMIIFLLSNCESKRSSPYDLVLENAAYATAPDSNGTTQYFVADTLFTGTFRSVLNDSTIEDMKIYKGHLRHRTATYEDGKLQYELRFVKDKKEGKHIYYFRNGSRKSYENYKAGKKHYQQYYWDKKGNLLKEEDYRDGKLQTDE